MTDLLRSLARRAATVRGGLAFLPPLLARIAVGLVFVQTGWGKLHGLEQVVDFFRQLGIPAPELQAPFVATVELVGGALVLLGLGARIAAVPLMATMLVAIATAIWPKADGFLDVLGSVEVLYLILFSWIAIAGPGAVSLDALIARATARHPGRLPDGAHTLLA
jgi:putative oxidoreductase